MKLSWNVPLMIGNIIDYYMFVVNQMNKNLTSPAVNVTLPHNGSTVVIALNAVNCLGNGPVTTMSMKIGINYNHFDMFLSLFIAIISHMSQLNQVWMRQILKLLQTNLILMLLVPKLFQTSLILMRQMPTLLILTLTSVQQVQGYKIALLLIYY